MSEGEVKQRVLVCVAWPYANGELHLGHVAGAYLPADIFARYMRLKGCDVLMVSGSDAHGTPILVRAEAEGLEPQSIVDRYSAKFDELWNVLDISFDIFTSTATENHRNVVQSFIATLDKNGYIYQKETEQYFDPIAHRFLPDRYVEGQCPHCKYQDARGDQCENCGRTLDPTDLINPTSKISGSEPVLRTSQHAFFRLSNIENALLEWVRPKIGWRNHVKKWTEGFVGSGLHDRAISRDLDWGVPVPEWLGLNANKRVYVWFEAVMGYLSATIEYADKNGLDWHDWWVSPDTASYYFVGKDNIPFHTVIWPAMLIAHQGLNLPTNVPANNYVLLGGKKASKSAGLGKPAVDYAKAFGTDALRYGLATLLPEADDTELTEDLLVERVNTELANGWGNLVSRTFALAVGQLDGRTPNPSQLSSAEDSNLMAVVDSALVESAKAFESVEIRRALRIMLTAVQDTNAYLSDAAPWTLRKHDAQAAAQVVSNVLCALTGLALGLSPFLPASSRKVLDALGIAGALAWERPALVADIELQPIKPLFVKLDGESIAAR